MISSCAGIDKYAFYLDFKGVLSSTPQVSVVFYRYKNRNAHYNRYKLYTKERLKIESYYLMQLMYALTQNIFKP
jgi:hypothetical protein